MGRGREPGYLLGAAAMGRSSLPASLPASLPSPAPGATGTGGHTDLRALARPRRERSPSPTGKRGRSSLDTPREGRREGGKEGRREEAGGERPGAVRRRQVAASPAARPRGRSGGPAGPGAGTAPAHLPAVWGGGAADGGRCPREGTPGGGGAGGGGSLRAVRQHPERIMTSRAADGGCGVVGVRG